MLLAAYRTREQRRKFPHRRDVPRRRRARIKGCMEPPETVRLTQADLLYCDRTSCSPQEFSILVFRLLRQHRVPARAPEEFVNCRGLEPAAPNHLRRSVLRCQAAFARREAEETRIRRHPLRQESARSVRAEPQGF